MIKGINTVKWLPWLMGLLGLSLAIALVTAYLGSSSVSEDQARARSAGRLADRLSLLPDIASRAAVGNVAAMENLRAFSQEIDQAKRGLVSAGIEAGNLGEWQSLEQGAAAVLTAESLLTDFSSLAVQTSSDAIGLMQDLQQLGLDDSQSPGVAVSQAGAEIRALIQALGAAQNGSANASQIATLLAQWEAVVPVSISTLLASSAVPQQRASDLRASHATVQQDIEALSQTIGPVIDVQAAALALGPVAERLRGQIGTAVSQAGFAGGFLANPWVHFTALILAALFLTGLIAFYFSSANVQRVAEEHARQNERNQEAILQLLDELGSLADGDLTVQATVTEHITGAIADSINYAIEALRNLVTTIKESAIMVDAAAKQAEATTSHLAAASETQAQQVGSATDSISRMAHSVEEVSGNAERAADVARHSVDVAHKGGEAVRRTIQGMNTIRETIQDTSKRIKRLGESSQEIGNIIELINDIAEQTNILALNASIQASMAGEAGRGFAVVADEVQRLAERSANATKQIEVLVRTIQSDTNEAVVSMERSTTDVVGGALLAENAGAALEEIEQVSNQIASLVQNISSSARQQSTAASDITRNTGVLREISEQTAESTNATSESISKLAELATELRRSVAGFTLPDFASGTAVLEREARTRSAKAVRVDSSGQDKHKAAQG